MPYHKNATVKYKNISALYVNVNNPSPNQNDLIQWKAFSFFAISNTAYFQANIVNIIIGKFDLKASHC